MSSRIPRLVLHVGIHKTGTTTLQVALESMRKQLRTRGVSLITIGQMKKLKHDSAWAAYRSKGHPDKSRFVEEFRALVHGEIEAAERKSSAPVRQVLITSERMVGARMPSTVDHPKFRPLAEEAMGEIISALDPEEVHVALYTRRQDRLMESCYLWEVQKGLSHPIQDQFPFMDDPVLRFSGLAERLVSIPRVDSMRVRPFEIISGGSLAYLDDFLSNVGLQGQLDYSGFKSEPSSNRSYSQKALDIALAINRHLDTGSQRTAARQFLKQHFPVGEYPSATILNEDERSRVVAVYREDNERLFSTWMPELPYDSYSTVDGVDGLRDVLSPTSVG